MDRMFAVATRHLCCSQICGAVLVLSKICCRLCADLKVGRLHETKTSRKRAGDAPTVRHPLLLLLSSPASPLCAGTECISPPNYKALPQPAQQPHTFGACASAVNQHPTAVPRFAATDHQGKGMACSLMFTVFDSFFWYEQTDRYSACARTPHMSSNPNYSCCQPLVHSTQHLAAAQVVEQGVVLLEQAGLPLAHSGSSSSRGRGGRTGGSGARRSGCTSSGSGGRGRGGGGSASTTSTASRAAGNGDLALGQHLLDGGTADAGLARQRVGLDLGEGGLEDVFVAEAPAQLTAAAQQSICLSGWWGGGVRVWEGRVGGWGGFGGRLWKGGIGGCGGEGEGETEKAGAH